jgi:hypothetical protein
MVQKRKNSAETNEGVLPQAVMRRPRICFERIIPETLYAEQNVRRGLREQLTLAGGGAKDLNADDLAQVARMPLIVSKKWSPWSSGFALRCCFLDGSTKMQKKVCTLAKEWEKHASVKLKFVPNGPAEVRISFYSDDGSWSAVGRDALNAGYFPLHEPTMNFGWVRDDSDPVEDRAVILHEFGLALGCRHEHQSPTFDRKWNRAAVMKYFQGPPNYWKEEEIRQNVLHKYSPKGLRATRFDPESIMLYSFDAELFSDGLGPTNENSQLSSTDRVMIKQMYPS